MDPALLVFTDLSCLPFLRFLPVVNVAHILTCNLLVLSATKIRSCGLRANSSRKSAAEHSESTSQRSEFVQLLLLCGEMVLALHFLDGGGAVDVFWDASGNGVLMRQERRTR